MAHKTVEVTLTEKHYTCDVCGKGARKYDKCCVCKKDLCHDHLRYDPDDNGDYPAKYCPTCLDLSAGFRSEKRRLEDECDAKVEVLEQEWVQKCLAAHAEFMATKEQNNG